jgi:diguanylate cyclase (GGDEF)-like protein/PAS domain S-box-containing protein
MKKQKLFITLSLTFLVMAIAMLLFEVLKDFVHQDITVWESNIYTIIFSSVLATVGAYFVVSRRELLTNRIMIEAANRQRFEEALKESEEKFRLLAAAAHDAIIMVDHEGSVVFWNNSAEKMFGYSNRDAVGKNCHGLIVPARYHEAYEKGFSLFKHSGQGAALGKALEVEARKKDGTEFPVELSLSGIHFHGEWSAVGIIRDITERKQVKESLQASEAKYYDLYDNAPDMYYSLDLATGVIIDCNKALLLATGYSKAELIGRSIFELYDASSAGEAKDTLQQFQVTGEVRDAERRVKCKDGRIINVSLNVSAIRDKDGNIVFSRSIWRDITELKMQEERVRTLSITDQLTALYNRRGFMTLAEQQLRVSERTRKGIVLLFADVDDLKQINDNLGHKSGDEAIIEAANVLKEVFRKMDIIARMGGDEFAVLATEASLEFSEMIRNRLQDQLVIHNSRAGRDYDLSLSIGMIYHDPSTPCSLDELISRADSLMYEQKRRKKP